MSLAAGYASPIVLSVIGRQAVEAEQQSDRLLKPYLGKHNGIYRECDLVRKLSHDLKFSCIPTEIEDVEFEGDCRVVTDTEPTIGELIDEARLTPKQRRAVRLLQRLKRQKLVALEMGITQPAVSRLIGQARRKVVEAGKRLNERAPSDWALKLWRAEIAYKRRITYKRRVTRGRRRSANSTGLRLIAEPDSSR